MLNLNYRALLRHSLVPLALLALCSGALAEEAAKPATTATPKPSPEQPKRAPRLGDIQRVFVIRHANLQEVGEVLSVFPATIAYYKYGPDPTALGVSGPPAVVAAIEETIKRLDVAPALKKSADITVYVIEALSAPQADAKVPPFLDPVVAQLKSTFRYADYRLADTLIARAIVDGRTKLRAVAVSEQQPEVSYSLRAMPALVSSANTRAIRMEGMEFAFTYSGGGKSGLSTIAADIYVPEGQYVVVGKSGTGQPGNALILVLSAKIID